MFHEIRGFFHGISSLAVDDSGSPVSEDLRLAAAVVLIETARLNKDQSSEEESVIFKALESNFGISSEQVHVLMENANSNANGDLTRFLKIINEHFDDEQKQIILAIVWKVIAADGVVDKYEAELATLIRTKFGLTMEQSIRARRLAESGEDITLEAYWPRKR